MSSKSMSSESIFKALQKYTVADDYDTIYHSQLRKLIDSPEFTISEPDGTSTAEILNMSFELTDPTKNTVNSKTREFNSVFAEKFFQWIYAGKSDVSELIPVNKNAKRYDDDNYHRNTAYGPRLLKQLPYILDELKYSEHSRRATINILDADDKEILPDLLSGRTTIEFPCTNTIQFVIRDGRLNMHVGMRSNNMVLTVCYDVYNFTNLMFKVFDKLKETYPDLELGSYYHNIASAHIIGKEAKLAKDILKEYDKRQ